ncbi:MAG: restriction endonuclease [Aliarcobacter sp.]|nr:restriction endonuclease [Aliarcobacter sp.]
MIDYDFSTLNDKEFEDLSIDLISKDKNKRFERFKVGKDGGIDGRFYYDDGTQEVIQCKHYLKTGFNSLISSLKKKNDKGINEIEKVKKLNPIKYIFVTSLPLSAENKKTIKELFYPHIKNDNDIYGKEDLNVILKNNPDIEKRYYKLWLSSTVVLDKIFNNAIESRSEFLLEDIKEKSKYYVVTENHDKAIEKLENSHIIIIAGEPGIGKTTLAEHLALWYIEKDFRFYNIENSINEAENIYKRDEKQIFYFDDFLGANYLNAIEDKKDSHIVKFIDRVKKDKTKRFILTSRTNIFNQGLALSDTFRSKNVESEEFIIKIESLKDIDKAMILYNHIWHSDLSENFIDEIYVDKRYKVIIGHKNFNPRLISFITDVQKISKEKIEANNYWSYVVEKLENPQDIWKNTFDKQSDDFIRIIVTLVVFNGNKIEESKLKNAYKEYIKLSRLQNDSHISKEFDSIIEEVVKYFLNRTQTYNKTIEYTLFNPSISDFILMRYRDKFEILENVFKSLQTLESLTQLKSLKSKIISEDFFNQIVLSLFENCEINKIDDADYIIELLSMQTFSMSENLKVKCFLQDLIDRAICFKRIYDFFKLISQFKLEEFKVKNYDFLSKLLNKYYHYNDMDIEYIIKLIEYFEIDDENINDDIKALIENYIECELDNRIHNNLYDEDIEYENDDEGNIYFDEEYVINFIDVYYEDLICDASYSFDVSHIDKNNMLKKVNIDSLQEQLVENYYNNLSGDSYEHQNVTFKIDNIDDLFER